MAIAIVMAGSLSSGCIDFAKGMQRAQYNYRAARRVCDAAVERQVCRDAVDEAYKEGADPATYVPKQERQRIDQQQSEERERRDRILARCDSATDLIRAAFAKHSYSQAYKVAEESEGICPQSPPINAALLAEVRKMSPPEVASCRSADIARLYWRPIEIWDWFAAAGRGNLISTNGVYIPGTVDQQFQGNVVVAIGETTRVVLRLDRGRFLRGGDMVYVIGRFVQIGQFATALGARVDMPVFDLVYWIE